MSFKQILVSSKVYKVFKDIIRKGESQSLFFTGFKSIGKLSMAMGLSKALNCQTFIHDFCDFCFSCKKINELVHPDFFLINTDDLFSKIEILHSYYVKENYNPKIIKIMKYYFNQFYYRYNSHFFILKNNSVQEESFISSYKKLFFDLENNDFPNETQLKKLDHLLNESKILNSKLTDFNIPIDTIRKLKKKISKKTNQAKVRCIIINGAEFMNRESANSFLKILEEPPKNNLIILISENPDLILPTIKSRCLHLHFDPLNMSEKKLIIYQKFGLRIKFDCDFDIWNILKRKDFQNNFLFQNFMNNLKLKNFNEDIFIFNMIENLKDKIQLKLFINELIILCYKTKVFQNNFDYENVKDENILFLSKKPDRIINKIISKSEFLISSIKKYNLNIEIILFKYLSNIFKLIK